MRLSDYVAQFLSDLSPWSTTRVYGVCGAGAMHLNDAICNHPGIRFVACHHEQAATMAAEADSRVSHQIGVVSVTAGPGGTNTITGLAGAWVDSIPVLVIAGQVQAKLLGSRFGLRQLGTNELDLVGMVGGITKYAVTVTDPKMIRYHLEKAVHLATSGRKGPVWVEIPLDVQSAEIDHGTLEHFIVPPPALSVTYLEDGVRRAVQMLHRAKRPVIIAGNGIHLAGAETEFRRLVTELNIPILPSWNGSDLIETRDSCYIGRPGLMGDRAGNFAVQNADVILAIGTRLSIPQIGHNPALFAPKAKLIVVDIDPKEANKPTLNVALSIVADAKDFIVEFAKQVMTDARSAWLQWLERCNDWKHRYPVMLLEYRETKDGVNSYYFVETLAKHLSDDAIVVTDVGFGFISAMQSLPLRANQRLFHSGGVSSMGYGLPASIGACLAGGGRQVVCLTGDGGLMFNLQELQTIKHHNLPISIFVFCNNAYSTMQYTQNTHFHREAASSPKSGVSCPDFYRLAKAFGIFHTELVDTAEMPVVESTLAIGRDQPVLCNLRLPAGQLLLPRVQSKMNADGSFTPTPIDDMWPYLDRAEYEANMAVGEKVM